MIPGSRNCVTSPTGGANADVYGHGHPSEGLPRKIGFFCRLRREIDRKEARIRGLESRLESFESDRGVKFEAANARLATPLTRREVQVLRRIARGDTNKAISEALRISDHTVKSHVINIFNKIGVNDRVQASMWGAMNGII